MIARYYIETLEEYALVIDRGHEPLIDTRFFILDIKLRVQLQDELFGLSTFGKRNIPKANEKFYRWCWERKIQVCEECLKPLNYAAVHISHILTKGGNAHMAHDPRNVNILCFKDHNIWEYATEEKKSKMKIYPNNIKRIKRLKTEYSLL